MYLWSYITVSSGYISMPRSSAILCAIVNSAVQVKTKLAEVYIGAPGRAWISLYSGWKLISLVLNKQVHWP